MLSLAASAFAAGLLGGVHCAGMCGGIAASLSASARGPLITRQVAFNSGRIGSYAVAGAAAGALGDLSRYAPAALTVQITLFALANGLMILLGLHIAGWSGAVLRLERAGGFVWRRIQPIARRLMPVDSTPRALAAGLAWGWVPCGLVYTMLVMALASGGALEGATVMAAFGAGTLPTLLAAGIAAQRLVAIRRAPWIRRAAGALVVASAVYGLVRVPGLAGLLESAWGACIAITTPHGSLPTAISPSFSSFTASTIATVPERPQAI